MAQHPGWPLVLEPVQDAIHPLGRQMPSPLAHLVCDLTEVARGMGKVENAQRIVPMALDKVLDPLGPILDSTDVLGALAAPPAKRSRWPDPQTSRQTPCAQSR
jgi:hypothetical protein